MIANSKHSLFAGVGLAFLLVTSQAQANLIQNGEFDAQQGNNSRNAANWDEDPLAGNGFLSTGARRTSILGENVMRVLNGSFSQTVSLAANTIYTFAFDVAGLGFSGTWTASVGNLLSVSGALSPITLINDNTFSFSTTAAGNYDVRFGATGAGIAAFDDVELTATGIVNVPGPEMGLGLPALAGIAGLHILRRRRRAA